MSRLLEIFGSALKFDTADLIWNWLDIILSQRTEESRQGGAQFKELRETVDLFYAKKIDSAEKKLLTYMAENPACPNGQIACAAIYISEGKIDLAMEKLYEIYYRHPNNTMALYALGHCSELKGCEADAIAFYQDCIKFKSYLQLPRKRLAAIYFKNGQLDKVIQEYEALRHDNPADIPVLVILGSLYLETARYQDAVSAFNAAILIHPDNFDDSDNQVEQLITEGRLEEAAQRLEEIIAEQPDRADLLVRYGDCLSMLGMSSEAINQYENALDLRPDYLEATIKLGTELVQTGNAVAAAIQFNRAFEINEQILDAYIGLAAAQDKAGSRADAMETLALACAIVPNSTLLFTQTAVLQMQAHLDHKKLFYPDDFANLLTNVIKAHQEQITRQNDNPDLLYRLGMLMCSANKHEQAIKVFQGAVELNPLFSRARNKLVLCQFESGSKQEALEHLTCENNLDKQSLDLHYKTALLYSDKIKFASSVINYENQLQSNITGCDNISYNISIVLQNLGLLDRTVLMWENLSDTARQAIKSKDAF